MNVTRTVRLTLGAAFASACAAATFAPLVRGWQWVVPVGVVLALITLVGLGMRQLTTNILLVLATQLFAVVIAMNALFTRGQSLLGLIPTPTSASAWRQLATEGSQVIAQTAPPVPATPGLLFLLTLGIGLIALVVDLISAGLERPAIAGLPLLAAYFVPAAVLPRGVGWGYFLIAAMGYLVLLGVDQADRVTNWGQVLGLRTRAGESSSGTTWNRLSVSGPLSGGRRLAIAALVAAVAIPMITPGVEDRALSSGRGSGDGRGKHEINVINPILTLRQNLTAPTNTVVIKYTTTATQPNPLRIATDDIFTGTTWEPSTGQLKRSQKVQDGLPFPPGLAASTPVTDQSANINVGNLHETYLPLPYPTRKITIDGNWLWEENSLNVVGDGQDSANTSYTADFVVPELSADMLSSAAPAPQAVIERYTELPSDLPVSIAQTARRVAGTGTAYDQTLRLQEWLRSTGGFTYSLDLSNDSGQDAVASFLVQKRGYCVQFASAMAVMARSLKIPSRVAVGFLPGQKTADGSYQISLRDAHAWPEMYFEGAGWVRFEPTPSSSRIPAPPAYAAPQDEAPAPQPSASEAATPSISPSASAGSAGSAAAAAAQEQDSDSEQSAAQSWWSRIPWLWLGLAVGLMLLGLLPLAAARLRRRRRWSTVRPDRLAEAGWDDLRQRLGDLGVRWLSSWTPRAAQHRLVEDYSLAGEDGAALQRLAVGVEDAWYAPPAPPGARTAAQVRADVDIVTAAVAAKVEPGARRRAKLFPRSGVDAFTGAERRRRAEEEFLAAMSANQQRAESVRAGESHETVTTGTTRRSMRRG